MTTTLTHRRASPPRTAPQPPAVSERSGQRNRTRMALGLVVVVLCVLIAMTLYRHATNRDEVIAVRRPIAAGQQITASDVETVAISTDPAVLTVAASRQGDVIGQIATVGLLPGSLLSPNQISAGPRVPPGMVIAGATLKPGQFPIGLRPGDHVMLVETSPSTATGAPGDPIRRGIARVLEVEQLKDSSSSIAVSLIVPVNDAATVAAAGAAGRLNLVVIGES